MCAVLWPCTPSHSQGDDAWSWRVEGQPVSVSRTVRGDPVSPTPVFLGANPGGVSYGGRTFIVEEMDRNRIAKVKIITARPADIEAKP